MDMNTDKWTLHEKLNQIATAKVGDPMPECLWVPTVWHGERVPLEGGGYIGVASNNWGPQLSAIAQEALDELERRREWQSLDTAPVPSATEINPRVYRFRCLLQDKKGYVFEGNAHYVQFSRARNPEWVLRWYDAANRLCSPMPIYWMPMPAPRSD